MATKSEIDAESKKIRKVRLLTDMVCAVLAEGKLSQVEMVNLIKSTRRFVLQLFPGKEETFNLLYRSRFERIIRQRCESN